MAIRLSGGSTLDMNNTRTPHLLQTQAGTEFIKPRASKKNRHFLTGFFLTVRFVQSNAIVTCVKIEKKKKISTTFWGYFLVSNEVPTYSVYNLLL